MFRSSNPVLQPMEEQYLVHGHEEKKLNIGNLGKVIKLAEEKSAGMS